MTDLCPSCGFNLRADEALAIGDWHLDPRGLVSFKGKRVLLRPAQCQILLAIARAKGRPLSSETLLARTSYSDFTNTVASQISRMRKTLRAEGIPDPIESIHKPGGYRWIAAL